MSDKDQSNSSQEEGVNENTAPATDEIDGEDMTEEDVWAEVMSDDYDEDDEGEEEPESSEEPEGETGSDTDGEDSATDSEPSVEDTLTTPQDDLARARSQLAAVQGRLAPTQRKLASTEARVAELESQLQSLTQGQSAEQPNSEQDLSAWEAHKRDFPEEGAAIEQLVGAQREQIANLQKQLSQLQGSVAPRLQQIDEEARTSVLEAERNMLVDGYGHNDWEDHVFSEQFGNWVDAHPESDRIKNELSEVSAYSYHRILTEYKNEHGLNQTTSAPAAEKQQSQVTQQRQQRLASAAAPSPGGSPSRPDEGSSSMSEEEMWAEVMADDSI